MTTKVFRRTGAVAVYSAWRATLVILVITLVIGGAGFAIGALATDGEDSNGGQGDAAAARQSAYDRGYAAGERDAAAREQRVRSESPAKEPATEQDPGKAKPRRTTTTYRNGYRDGAAAVAGKSQDLRPGSVYFVKVRRGPRGVPYTIEGDVAIQAGRLYRVCAGGNSICERP